MTAPATEPAPDTGADQRITVQGYHEGTSYALVIDPSQTDQDYGVIADSTDPRLTAKITAGVGGPTYALHPTGGAVPVSKDTVEGVLAGCQAHTEVTQVTGALPENLAEDTPSSNVVY